MAGVETGPPNVPGLPKPESSMRTSRTLGAPSGGVGWRLMLQSATDLSSVRPMAPPKSGSRIGSTVRSGLNLPIASASEPFRARTRPDSSECTRDLATAPGSAWPIASRYDSSNAAMIPADPAGRAAPILSPMPDSSLRFANVPTIAPAAAPTATEASNGGANRPTSTPTPPPQPAPFRPTWSPVSATVTLPSASWVTRMIPSTLTLFARTSSASASKSCLAASTSGYAATSTSVRDSVTEPPRVLRARTRVESGSDRRKPSGAAGLVVRSGARPPLWTSPLDASWPARGGATSWPRRPARPPPNEPWGGETPR